MPIHRIHKWRLTWGEYAAKHIIEAFLDKNYRSSKEELIREVMSLELCEDNITGSSLGTVASHADVLRGSSRVPAPRRNA